jgi:hypothetical protein
MEDQAHKLFLCALATGGDFDELVDVFGDDGERLTLQHLKTRSDRAVRAVRADSESGELAAAGINNAAEKRVSQNMAYPETMGGGADGAVAASTNPMFGEDRRRATTIPGAPSTAGGLSEWHSSSTGQKVELGNPRGSHHHRGGLMGVAAHAVNTAKTLIIHMAKKTEKGKVESKMRGDKEEAESESRTNGEGRKDEDQDEGEREPEGEGDGGKGEGEGEEDSWSAITRARKASQFDFINPMQSGPATATRRDSQNPAEGVASEARI